METKAKVLDPKMQDEMIGVLTAISIVSKRLACRLLQIDENKSLDKDVSPETEVKSE